MKVTISISGSRLNCHLLLTLLASTFLLVSQQRGIAGLIFNVAGSPGATEIDFSISGDTVTAGNFFVSAFGGGTYFNDVSVASTPSNRLLAFNNFTGNYLLDDQLHFPQSQDGVYIPFINTFQVNSATDGSSAQAIGMIMADDGASADDFFIVFNTAVDSFSGESLIWPDVPSQTLALPQGQDPGDPAGPVASDFNSFKVGDYQLFGSFNNGLGTSATLSVTAVPEPTGFILSSTLITILAWRRQRPVQSLPGAAYDKS